MSAAAAARAMGGELSGPPGAADALLAGVSIDSRTLRPGELFFAVRGARFDGHDFVPDALAAGGAGAVVERSFPGAGLPASACLIRVGDPTGALGELARRDRLDSGARIVAITGSVGKTTTKEAAAAALASAGPVFRSAGNRNNHWGLPLALLARREEPVGVVELGMSAAGEIAALTRIAVPDCGVITRVGEAHLASFDSVEAIAAAKGELFDGLGPEAVSVVNRDDPRVEALGRRRRERAPAAPQIGYGFDSGAEVEGRDYRAEPDGLSFEARAFSGRWTRVHSGLTGRHNASNVLGGLAPLPGRGRRIPLSGGAVVWDETYNSSPTALRALVAELAASPARRRILVAGDMLELGDRAEELHAACGAAARRAGLDLVVGVGPLGRVLAAAAGDPGSDRPRVLAAETVEAAAELLEAELGPGDLALFKASRGVGLETAVERLRGAV